MSTCSVAPLSRRALSLLLHNKWVAVLGDSVARLFCAALLRLGGEHSVEQPVLDRHRSFEYRLAARGSHLSFVWAPYAENITAALASWRQDGHVPDVIVMGSSLWHMLHVRNVTHYAASLAGIRVTLDALLASERRMPIAPFWMTTTALVGHKLNTPEKQAHLTPGHVDAYDAAAAALLAPAAGGPCIVLDVHQVTAGTPHSYVFRAQILGTDSLYSVTCQHVASHAQMTACTFTTPPSICLSSNGQMSCVSTAAQRCARCRGALQ